jgi:hypothetical protein
LFYLGSRSYNYYGGCSTDKQYEGGHDHTMYQYRLQSETFNYVKHIFHKFIYSNFIQNWCEDEYDGNKKIKIHNKKKLSMFTIIIFNNCFFFFSYS